MPDFVVKDAEGNESSVTLPDGWRVLSDDDFQTQLSRAAADDERYMLKDSLQRRLKNYVRKDEAHEDEDVVTRVLREHGSKKNDVNADSLKKAWNDEIAEPLRKENGLLNQMITGAAIREAFGSIFDDRFTKPGPGGGPSWVEMEFGRQVAIDREKGKVLAVRDGGDFRPSRRADNTGYMDVFELADVVKEMPEYKPFLRPDEKGGAGADVGKQTKGAAGQGGSGDVMDVLKRDGVSGLKKQLGMR